MEANLEEIWKGAEECAVLCDCTPESPYGAGGWLQCFSSYIAAFHSLVVGCQHLKQVSLFSGYSPEKWH